MVTMIFAVFDLSPLTLWINCCFLTLIQQSSYSLIVRRPIDLLFVSVPLEFIASGKQVFDDYFVGLGGFRRPKFV